MNYCLIFQLQAIRKPGACHRARWMAKLIYALKIFLYRNEFSLTAQELVKLREFIKFILKLYVKPWFMSRSAILAAFNDLQFLQNVENYHENSNISNAVFKSFSNHLWYLSEPLIALALFDDRISIDEKKMMVENLQKEKSDTYLKRIKLQKNEIHNTSFSDFVSNRTRQFLIDFEIDIDWLEKDPSTWPKNESYKSAKHFFSELQVVNDCAERSLHLAQNYNAIITKDKIQKECLLFTVQQHKSVYSNCSKSVLFSKHND